MVDWYQLNLSMGSIETYGVYIGSKDTCGAYIRSRDVQLSMADHYQLSCFEGLQGGSTSWKCIHTLRLIPTYFYNWLLWDNR